MDIKLAQQDMRAAYVAGAPGVFVSGLVWIAAGLTLVQVDFKTSLLVFFFGGMLIFPLSVAISKFLLRAPSSDKANPFNRLSLENTVILFAGLFIAYFSVQASQGWFYPIMLLVIGARYFPFATVYGNRMFWALGAALIAFGFANLIVFDFDMGSVPIIGGAIEIAFALILLIQGRNKN